VEGPRLLASLRRPAHDRDRATPADALSITDDESALAHAHREATSRRGAIKHVPDHDELDGQVLLPTRLKARLDGFDLDAEAGRLGPRSRAPRGAAPRFPPAAAPA
jgi:hypothetical protein